MDLLYTLLILAFITALMMQYINKVKDQYLQILSRYENRLDHLLDQVRELEQSTSIDIMRIKDELDTRKKQTITEL